MTPPTVIEDNGDSLVVRKRAGKTEDRLEIRLLEVLSDASHEMGEAAALEKDGVERDLQELLAERPDVLSNGRLRLVRREWPTDIGPVDLMCRDADDELGARSRSSTSGRSTRSISSAAISSASDSIRPSRTFRAFSPRNGSGRRRWCTPTVGASVARRSTSRCFAASASPR